MIIVNAFVLLNIAFLSIILLTKNNPLPNKLLATILIVPGLNFLNNINILTGVIFKVPILFFIVQGTATLFAPLVYSYIRLLSGKKIRFKNLLFIATCIIIIADIFLAIKFFSMNKENQDLYLVSIIQGTYPADMELYNVVLFVHQLIYFTFCSIDIFKRKKIALQSISNLEGTEIRYLSQFINLCWILTLVTVILYISPLPTIYVEYIFLPIVLIIIFYFILYYGFKYNFIFTKSSYKEFLENNEQKILEAETNNQAQVIEDTELEKTIVSIESYLSNHETFTKPDLTIYSLSSETKIPVKKISFAINKIKGKNFYDFINDKRIEKSILLLKTFPKHTIDSIAIDSGFKSRSTFYRAFKKNTGITPTEYMHKLLADNDIKKQ